MRVLSLVEESEQAEEIAMSPLVGAVIAVRIEGAAHVADRAALDAIISAEQSGAQAFGALLTQIVAATKHPNWTGSYIAMPGTRPNLSPGSCRTVAAAIQLLDTLRADIAERRAKLTEAIAERRTNARDLKRAVRALSRIVATPTKDAK